MKLPFALLALAVSAAHADVVTNTLPSGPGSLRAVFTNHLLNNTGPITFAPELSGKTITGSGEFRWEETFEIHPIRATSLEIDARSLPGGITISGSGRIFFMPLGPHLTLRNVTLTGAGTAAVSCYDNLELTDCTFTGNGGVAVSLLNSNGNPRITRCTFTGNGTAVTCGAYGYVTLTHCTVSGNNKGVDIGYRYPGMKVSNCIIAGNGQDVYNLSSFTRVGANMIQTHTNSGSDPYPGHDSGPAAINAAPLLAPLGNYGGPTMTMALLPGSPARNASAGSTATNDQRGAPIAGIPDIGAYESGSTAHYNGWIFESLPATATAAQRDAAFDFDGDGLSNGDEFNYLTGPASAGSFFAPLAAREDASLRFSFASASGRNYALQQNDTLSSAAWTNIPGQPLISGDGSVKSFLVPAGAPPRQFFRIMGAP